MVNPIIKFVTIVKYQERVYKENSLPGGSYEKVESASCSDVLIRFHGKCLCLPMPSSATYES